MAEYTTNYNLKKPDQDDFYNVEDFNGNADIVDGALNTLSTGKETPEGAQEKADTALATAKTYTDAHSFDLGNPHNVTAAQVGASGSNLLINGDFQVWQRGTEFESTGFSRYTADRWYTISINGIDTVKIEKASADGGLRMTTTLGHPCFLWYKMEENDLARLRGKIVTLSYSINGIISTGTLTVPINLAENDNLINFGIGNNDVVNWVKLELGSVATPFIPRSYAVELAACQRYYKLMEVNRLAIPNYADRRAWVGFNFSDMRKPPTVSGTVALHNRVGEIQECDIRFHAFSPKTMNIEVTATENSEANMWLLGSVALDAEIY